MKSYEIRFVTHWGVQTFFVEEGQMPTPPPVIDPVTGIENFAEGNYFCAFFFCKLNFLFIKAALGAYKNAYAHAVFYF